MRLFSWKARVPSGRYFAGIGFGVNDKFGDGFGGELRCDDQNLRLPIDHADRNDVTKEVEAVALTVCGVLTVSRV